MLVLCPVLAGVASVLNDHLQQRRRIGTEAKAKVVACIWEAEFVPFLACCFAVVYLKEKVEFILFFQIARGKTASAARNSTSFAPQTAATTF